MTVVRYITIISMILVITACGRRLPDDYFDVTSDNVVEAVETEDAPASDVETDDTEATTSDAESADDTPAEATEAVEASDAPETETDDENAEETEPQFELVEVPADPIVEQVANADPTNGEQLFGSGVACTSCHNVASDAMLVGPGFLNLPQRAEDRVDDQVAERYLYNSITHPNDYVVEGYVAGVMPQNYADTYSEEEILDIVAYLMTLGEYPDREPVFVEVPIDEPAEDERVDEAPETEEPTPSDESDAEPSEADDTPAEATEEGDVVYIVVTATPAPSMTDEEASDASDDSESPAIDEPIVIGIPSEPNFDIDLSGVPGTIDILAQRGSPRQGEALFNEGLVNSVSCAMCHSVDGNPAANQTDVSYVGTLDNAPAYVWATIFDDGLHPGLASEYERVLSGADTAHLVAYLISLSQPVDE